MVGYGLTLSVAGAEVGVPLAAFGQTVSSIGNISEFFIDIANGEYKNIIKKGFYIGIDLLSKKALSKTLPGFGKKPGEVGFDLGTEIIRQGTNLKISGLERVTDIINEKNNQKE